MFLEHNKQSVTIFYYLEHMLSLEVIITFSLKYLQNIRVGFDEG